MGLNSPIRVLWCPEVVGEGDPVALSNWQHLVLCVVVEGGPLQGLLPCWVVELLGPVKGVAEGRAAAVVLDVPQHQLATDKGAGQADDQGAKVICKQRQQAQVGKVGNVTLNR